MKQEQLNFYQKEPSRRSEEINVNKQDFNQDTLEEHINKLQASNQKPMKRKDNLNVEAMYKIVRLEELHDNPLNSKIYLAQEDRAPIEKLKASIRANGLINPIVCRKAKEGYTILSGHLRKTALVELVEEGLLQFQKVKISTVYVEKEDELEYLLDANVVIRNRSDYSKMEEVNSYASIYENLKDRNQLPEGMSANMFVASKMDMSQRQIAKYMYIKNKLEQEAIHELLKEHNMSLDKIYALMKKHGDEFSAEYFTSSKPKEKVKQIKEEKGEPLNLLVKERKAITKVLNDLERVATSSESLLDSDNLYKTTRKQITKLKKAISQLEETLVSLLDD